MSLLSVHQIFRNAIDIKLVIKRENTKEETIIKASPYFTGYDTIDRSTLFIPAVIMEDTSDENTIIIEFKIFAIGNCPKYASDNRYVTADDTIEEVTVTFIPNNTFVEAENNEESV